MTSDTSWLDGPKRQTVRIESTKLRGEKARGARVQKSPGKKVTAWHCDGQFVWFRRRLANPTTLTRLTTQIAKGELKHVTTSDDVEIYEVQATSPFKREEQNLQAIDFQTLTRNTVLAACKRDWATFVDGLQEVAFRLKNARYTDGKPAQESWTRELYEDRVTHIFNMIKLRGGPSTVEIDREVGALRQRRGDNRSRTTILLPS